MKPPTSDVTRLRGVAVAAGVAAVVAVVAVAALARWGTWRGAPGPLSDAHRAAGVSCAACHGGERARAAPAAARCVACHGAHPPDPSARPGHRALAAAGKLGCGACHRGHREHDRVVIATDGRASRGAAVMQLDGFRPAAAIAIPLVAASACGGCHDLATPRDPITACVVSGRNVCFDEHRAVRGARGELAARAPAWSAAREVAASTPAPATPTSSRGGLVAALGLAALAAIASGVIARGVGARKAKWEWRPQRSPSPQRSPAPSPWPRPVVELSRLPVIDGATCLGCHACADACPFDVLEIRRYVAFVARPADCCGLTLCEQRCPNGSLTMRAGPTPAVVPAVRHDLESTATAGVFLVGDAAGGALIRNAVDQGARAIASIAERLAAAAAAPARAQPTEPADAAAALDVVIIGAGPAGLSAALEAKARGLRHVVLEQGAVAESIRSFPRGKLVMDHAGPGHGRLWLAETTKEALIARWLLAIRRDEPVIREHHRVTAVARDGAGFVVRAVDRRGNATALRAAHVVVAVGRRGSPRTLPLAIPPGWREHVHYALADARSFAGRRVLVVGLGDVAMETAIALSRQPDTQVSVSYRGARAERGKARNLDELQRRIAAGAIAMHWRTEVAALEPGRAILTEPGHRPRAVACDAVLVMIGALPAPDLLGD